MHKTRVSASTIIACGVLSLASPARAGEEPVSQTFDANGVKIHYLTLGKGEPVVLIHGLYSSADINWRLTGVMADLAKDHKVIAIDMPGHGRSDKPEKDEAYGVQIVEDVALLLDHLQIKKAHVVGYSLGGMVTVKFMVKHPDRVLSGSLGGMGWFKEGSGLQKIWEKMPGGGRMPAAFLKNVGQLAVTADELKKIELPVKVFVGDKDVVKPLYVEPLQKIRSDWPVIEITDADHFTCIIKRQFRDEVVSWVKKNTK